VLQQQVQLQQQQLDQLQQQSAVAAAAAASGVAQSNAIITSPSAMAAHAFHPVTRSSADQSGTFTTPLMSRQLGAGLNTSVNSTAEVTKLVHRVSELERALAEKDLLNTLLQQQVTRVSDLARDARQTLSVPAGYPSTHTGLLPMLSSSMLAQPSSVTATGVALPLLRLPPMDDHSTAPSSGLGLGVVLSPPDDDPALRRSGEGPTVARPRNTALLQAPKGVHPAATALSPTLIQPMSASADSGGPFGDSPLAITPSSAVCASLRYAECTHRLHSLWVLDPVCANRCF